MYTLYQNHENSWKRNICLIANWNEYISLKINYLGPMRDQQNQSIVATVTEGFEKLHYFLTENHWKHTYIGHSPYQLYNAPSPLYKPPRNFADFSNPSSLTEATSIHKWDPQLPVNLWTCDFSAFLDFDTWEYFFEI